MQQHRTQIRWFVAVAVLVALAGAAQASKEDYDYWLRPVQARSKPDKPKAIHVAPGQNKATLAVAEGCVIDPTISLDASAKSVEIGEVVTFTATIEVPANEPGPATGIVVHFTPCSALLPTVARRPLVCENQAMVIWDPEQSAVSNIVRVTIIGRTEDVPPQGGSFVVPLPDMDPGDVLFVEFDCQAQ